MSGLPPWDEIPPALQQQILNGPAQPPPEGVEAFFGRTPDNNRYALGVTIACLVITAICVFFRAYAQIVIKRRVGVEDGLGIVALVAYAGVLWTAFELLDLHVYHNHQWDFTLLDFSDVLFAIYILPCCAAAFIGFAKSAILLEWSRIFVPARVRNKFWWTCIAVLTANAMFSVGSFVAPQFYCTPHERIWRRWIDGTCNNRKAMDLPIAIFNIITSVLILLLPQGVIWRLQITRWRRVGISVVFSVGILAVVCSIGRAHSIVTFDFESDVTFNLGDIELWTLAECTCVLLVFCVPAMPHVYIDSWFHGKIKTALRSVKPPTHSNMNKSTLAPSTGEGRTPKNSPYSLVRDDNSQVHLANLETIIRPSSIIGAGNSRDLGNSGIVCTTDFTRHEYYISKDAPREWLPRPER